MANLPVQYEQGKNFEIRNRTRLGEFGMTVDMPSADIREGEFLIPGSTGWVRCLNAFTAQRYAFPVIDRPKEYNLQVMRSSVNASFGKATVMIMSPLVIRTRMYDFDGTYTAGAVVYVGTITVVAGVYTGIWAGITDNAGGMAAGRVLKVPSADNNWLTVLLTF